MITGTSQGISEHPTIKVTALSSAVVRPCSRHVPPVPELRSCRQGSGRQGLTTITWAQDGTGARWVPSLLKRCNLRCHQTWLAGKWTI